MSTTDHTGRQYVSGRDSEALRSEAEVLELGLGVEEDGSSKRRPRTDQKDRGSGEVLSGHLCGIDNKIS